VRVGANALGVHNGGRASGGKYERVSTRCKLDVVLRGEKRVEGFRV
jgi:hypothetical protein